MTNIFWIFIGCVAFFGTIVSFWRFGHYGVWGEMIKDYKHHSPDLWNKMKGEIIYIKDNDKWTQWSLCVVEFEQDNINIIQTPILNWAVPSLRIPIKEIIVMSEKRFWFMKYVVLGFRKNSCQLAIKSVHKEALRTAELRKT